VPPAVLKSVPGRRTPSTRHSMQRRGNRNRNIIWHLVYNIRTWHMPTCKTEDVQGLYNMYIYQRAPTSPQADRQGQIRPRRKADKIKYQIHQEMDKIKSNRGPRQIRSNQMGAPGEKKETNQIKSRPRQSR
jgi:hypothetical protein